MYSHCLISNASFNSLDNKLCGIFSSSFFFFSPPLFSFARDGSWTKQNLHCKKSELAFLSTPVHEPPTISSIPRRITLSFFYSYHVRIYARRRINAWQICSYYEKEAGTAAPSSRTDGKSRKTSALASLGRERKRKTVRERSHSEEQRKDKGVAGRREREKQLFSERASASIQALPWRRKWTHYLL